MAVPEVVKVIKGDSARYDAYARRADLAMLVMAFAFLVVWSARIAFRDYIPGALRGTLITIQAFIWLAFVVDIIIRLALTDRRWHFLKTHPIDVIAVFIPPARPLKILSVFTSGTMLASRKGAVKSTQAILISVVLLMWIGAVSILDAERGAADAQITNFADAIWWALVTMTTVGYGDFAPVTGQGRAIATVLMLMGIALIGVITASVAAWFVALTEGEDEERDEVTRTQLLDRLAELESKLDAIAAREDAAASGLPHQTPKAPRRKARATPPAEDDAT
ncbi:potassium channel family protein [Demequina lignilytica]|uniref:Ion channel n=1 Tax=Demequina lignilytica TaxID=3051663 RepID=A0AAW7LZT4_9MICO|nr:MULTISPECIES: potassium channel family protein [unclassified Demequina]MDN4478535.1 ion channel [Demequina sp. SYSU T00039-1]MDN4482307.1 ion channel [Demequina sp. SYSU T0a273]MDN4486958.1 ion channel [Demequina sp. SYSU T00039]